MDPDWIYTLYNRVYISTSLLQIRVSNYKLFGPRHDKTNKMNECVQSEDSDQTGHSPSMIRDLAVRSTHTDMTEKMLTGT